MKVCVFGAASSAIDKSYIEAIEHLGEALAKRGHSLVFGAGGNGLMGAAARGVRDGGGGIVGLRGRLQGTGGIDREGRRRRIGGRIASPGTIAHETGEQHREQQAVEPEPAKAAEEHLQKMIQLHGGVFLILFH